MQHTHTLTRTQRVRTLLALTLLFTTGSAVAQSHVVVSGNVFGGGNAAAVSGSTSVLMQDNALVETSVYGGGALANTGTNTEVNIEGGTVTQSVYGGGLGDATHAANVGGTATVNIGRSDDTPTVTDGVTSYNNVVVGENVFGANNQKGTPAGNVTVNIYHTKHTAANQVPDLSDVAALMAAAHAKANFAIQGVYGGGNEADYAPAANCSTTVTIYGCENTVKMVYGGGRAAAVGTSGGPTTNAFVVVQGGRLDTLFAGGDGHTTDALGNYRPANIYGNATAAIHGGYHGAAFAGSNTRGTISGTKTLTIDKSGPCSDGADDDDQEELIGFLFGGGNMADITGDVTLTVECGAGELNEVYGGCNLADIGTQTLFDGGTPSNVTLNFWGGTVENIYGGSRGRAASDPLGAKAANIYGNVTLNLMGGTVTNAFGGSNINGNITGKITVNVLDAEDVDCPLVVENVYGGGNLTAYTPKDPSLLSPEVNVVHIKKGNRIAGDVFGGGLGLTATVTANPKVTIGAEAPSPLPAGYMTPASNYPYVTVGNNVYGGGNAAEVDGNTQVVVKGSKTRVYNNVYGGGNAATVTGNTDVHIGSDPE